MKKILIIYPPDFSCFKKFERKITRITSSIRLFKVTAPHDKKNLILNLSRKMNFDFEIINQEEKITHAIIFNHKNLFDEEIKRINNSKIPLRVIELKLTSVINIKNNNRYGKNNTNDYEYIGRGSKWGNPYSMYENGDDRDEVIRKFKYDFDHDKFLNIKKIDFLSLRGKTLGCFCKPYACHGDVIAEYLNSIDDGE